MEFKTTDTRYTAPVTRVLIVTPARCIAGSKTNTAVMITDGRMNRSPVRTWFFFLCDIWKELFLCIWKI